MQPASFLGNAAYQRRADPVTRRNVKRELKVRGFTAALPRLGPWERQAGERAAAARTLLPSTLGVLTLIFSVTEV